MLNKHFKISIFFRFERKIESSLQFKIICYNKRVEFCLKHWMRKSNENHYELFELNDA